MPLDLQVPNGEVIRNNSLIYVSYLSKERIEVSSKKGSEWWTSSDVYERVGQVGDGPTPDTTITLFNLDLIHAAGDGRSVNKLVSDFLKAIELGGDGLLETGPDITPGYSALRDL